MNAPANLSLSSDAAASPALTALAYENADLLLRLRAQDFPSKGALADGLGRSHPNLNKTLHKLAAEELVDFDATALTGKGLEAAALYDRILGVAAPADGARLDLRHDQIEEDPENDREVFDKAEIEGLAMTMLSHGVLQHPRVRPLNPETGRHTLSGGARRHRAWGWQIAQGHWTPDHTETCEIDTREGAAQVEAALIENECRVALNHLERGKAYEKLAVQHGRTNDEIALLVGKSPEYVQQHRRLLRCSEEDQAALMAGELSLHQALKNIATPRPAEAKAWAPRPDHVLVLVEIAHKIHHDPHGIFPGSTRAGRSAQTDQLLQVLVREGFAGWAGVPHETRIWLEPTAQELIARLWPNLFLTERLEAARRATQMGHGMIADLQRRKAYALDWLNYTPTADADRDAAEGTPAAQPAPQPNKAADRNPDAPPRLTTAQILRLAEVRHAVEQRPSTAIPGTTDVMVEIHTDQPWTAMIQHGLCASVRGPEGSAAGVMPRGVELLNDLGLEPSSAAVLQAVRERAGVPDDVIPVLVEAGLYAVDWINPEPVDPLAQPGGAPKTFAAALDQLSEKHGLPEFGDQLRRALAEPDDASPAVEPSADERPFADEDDEDATPDDVFEQMDELLQAADDFDPLAAFDLARIRFPLHVGVGGELGVIFDADRSAVLTVDSDAEARDRLVMARVLLLSALLNEAWEAARTAPRWVDPKTRRDTADPPVAIRKSIKDEEIVCLEDGVALASITSHLRKAHGLSAAEYRQRWGLARDYPTVAAAVGWRRRDIAHRLRNSR